MIFCTRFSSILNPLRALRLDIESEKDKVCVFAAAVESLHENAIALSGNRAV